MYHLPLEILLNIDEFYNPYKNEYKKTIELIKNKYVYTVCMRQLKQYCLYNRDKELIVFNVDAILNTI